MDNLEQEKVKRKDGWERDLLEKLASSSIIEQLRARR